MVRLNLSRLDAKALEERRLAARRQAFSTPLSQFHPGDPELFRSDSHWPYFERLRKEEPVHWCKTSPVGPYWSVTKYHDIVKVDTSPAIFSSDLNVGGFMLRDPAPEYKWPSFIAMDEPAHGPQRASVGGMFEPDHLERMETAFRRQSAEVLDKLPTNEVFDFVERVAIELTTQMLAMLFDFPFEDRRKLTRWSDVATALPKSGVFESEAQRRAEFAEMDARLSQLWNERRDAAPRPDLISMMAHSEATRKMGKANFLGNVILLIVGGNDTTRNSMTGSVLALNEFPNEYEKLRANLSLIESFASEAIRWQTPLAHMRRTALQDTELGDKIIRKGDRVAMWYVSGNRDDEVIEDADRFVIDRPYPRRHLSFGFGPHRCIGRRLAELQLKVLWEELLRRFSRIEVVGEPTRVLSNFVRGYASLPVRLHA